jgi:hypothetical protein
LCTQLDITGIKSLKRYNFSNIFVKNSVVPLSTEPAASTPTATAAFRTLTGMRGKQVTNTVAFD